jgi:hypothetical protein
MKKLIFTAIISFSIFGGKIAAQQATSQDASESFGNTLNLGVGIGYYGYIGHTLPVVHADYEFNVAKNFTLAPFVTVYSYRNYYYWGNPNYPYRNYYYRETVIPVGVKGCYYFDQLLHAGPKWDFYLGASLGFAFRRTIWESGYYGETTIVDHGTSGLYLDGHIGTEYHMNDRLGLYLDLSSGISTFGLAIHM